MSGTTDYSKTRHVSELKEIPIHQMSDEEVVKAIQNRFNGRCAMIMYWEDLQPSPVILFRYKNARGKWLCDTLMHLWKTWAGGAKRITNKKPDLKYGKIVTDVRTGH